MKATRPFGLKGVALIMSLLMVGSMTLSAGTKEPGPLEKFFRWVGNGFKEPHKTSTHRSTHKQSTMASPSPSNVGSNAQNNGLNTGAGASANLGAPPSERNTRSTSRVTTKKGEDLPYGTPVPGKEGFVTSPFSPNSGYIDVRGFAPGTPVRDPYTGKVFLTP